MKSGKKWLKVMKIDEKLEKVRGNGKKWGKWLKVGESWEKLEKVVKSGEKL